MFSKFILVAAVLLTSGLMSYKKEYDLPALWRANKLVIHNREVTSGSKAGALKLSEKDGEGMVWLSGVKFSEGTIEVDIKGQDVLQKSFVGIAFHGQNNQQYEAVYFRPFNFHAEDSIRRIHAVQYVSHPQFTWKKLRDDRNGEFEKAVKDAPDPNGWFHATIKVKGNTVEVFVNEMTKPSLAITKLNQYSDGMIGLWVGAGSGGEFANLKILPLK